MVEAHTTMGKWRQFLWDESGTRNFVCLRGKVPIFWSTRKKYEREGKAATQFYGLPSRYSQSQLAINYYSWWLSAIQNRGKELNKFPPATTLEFKTIFTINFWKQTFWYFVRQYLSPPSVLKNRWAPFWNHASVFHALLSLRSLLGERICRRIRWPPAFPAN